MVLSIENVFIPISSLYLQENGPIYDNVGFQHEEGRPPSYAPQLYPPLPQETPNYVALAPKIINTHHTVIPGTPHRTAQKKGTVMFDLRFVKSLL